MTGAVFDPTPCGLGEGPLWHPERRQLFWFDILKFRLHSREDGRNRTWQFGEHVSAAGWVDRGTLLIASETRLFRFDLETGVEETVVALEAETPATRSNDGRADPWGGFWIGTMGKASELGQGAIYRYFNGNLEVLFPDITIPNAICFSPDRRHAYFTDTPTGIVKRQALDGEGWPDGPAEDWLDLTVEGWRPDGAVVDAGGNVWNAQWGGYRVACYSPGGQFLRAVAFPAAQTSCPAFGGDDLTTLFCTSARAGLSAEALASVPEQGMTFEARGIARGQAEHRVIL